jgi:hypothetical protein
MPQYSLARDQNSFGRGTLFCHSRAPDDAHRILEIQPGHTGDDGIVWFKSDVAKYNQTPVYISLNGFRAQMVAGEIILVVSADRAAPRAAHDRRNAEILGAA